MVADDWNVTNIGEVPQLVLPCDVMMLLCGFRGNFGESNPIVQPEVTFSISYETQAILFMEVCDKDILGKLHNKKRNHHKHPETQK